MTLPSAAAGARGRRSRRALAVAAFAAAALTALPLHFGRAQAAPPPTSGAVRVGDFAPNFSLTTLSGETFSLSDHVGKRPVLIIFWSFFCFPCQKEMPELQSLAGEIGADALTVVGVGLDGPAYDERVVPFCRDKGITFPIVHDKETEEYFETAERYGVVGTPTSFLIDLQGRIRLIHLGRLDREMLVGAIKASRDQSYCSEITKPPPRSPK